MFGTFVESGKEKYPAFMIYADLRIPQDPLPLAQPEGGVGVDPLDARGPGTSSDLEQLTRLVSGDHGLHSSISPGGKSEVGLRPDVSDRPLCTPVFGHVMNIAHSKSTLDTAAQARIAICTAPLPVQPAAFTAFLIAGTLSAPTHIPASAPPLL